MKNNTNNKTGDTDMELFKHYKQYVQQHSSNMSIDELNVIKERYKKWQEYEKKAITLDSAHYVPEEDWVDEVLRSDIGFKWRDHERMIYFNGKPALITSEPYGIPQKYILKLVKVGEELGFSVSLNDRFASHVGDTGCCIEIAPIIWLENQIGLENCLRFERN